MPHARSLFPAALLIAALAGCGNGDKPKVSPPGDPASSKTVAPKTGAAPQASPVGGMDVYLEGFHPMKDDPKLQVEAHHYCRQMSEDFAQCAIFDSNSAQANLTGIEYIISEKIFATLPDNEKRYWHPHNGEILSGQLIAPGLPETAEKELMRSKMNSYGKTWQLWMTDRGDKLPMGDPMLAWSFNRDGEIRPKLIEDRDLRLKMTTIDKRRARTDLMPLAKP
ncbi:MAG TPA: OBAP family protein, partial [Burkholderiales bacterium]|nr:OBAP family protein [Burkholderiales bacterium]